MVDQLRNRDLAVQRGLLKIRVVLHDDIKHIDDERNLDNQHPG